MRVESHELGALISKLRLGDDKMSFEIYNLYSDGRGREH
jgi:hypothetical protein